jgi:hypothetical protein
LPLVSIKARTWGFITQPRYRSATDPDTAALPDTRCAPGSRESDGPSIVEVEPG